MSRWSKRLILPLVVLLIVIQALQPARTNPPIASNHEMQTNLTVNRAVSEVLSRSCNDCHSNRTAWPW